MSRSKLAVLGTALVMLLGAEAHSTIRMWPGEGIDAAGNPAISAGSAAAWPGGYGFLTEIRIPHGTEGKYTYKIEIMLPTQGEGMTLCSAKPSPIPGWKLTYDPTSESKELNSKIVYLAEPGRELHNDWHLQIPLRVCINCGAKNDPLVQKCGTTTDDGTGTDIFAVLFPIHQHLCEMDPAGACIPDGNFSNWNNWISPSEFSGGLSGRCYDRANTDHPSAYLKVIQPQSMVSESCLALTTTPPNFALPLNAPEGCIGASCNAERNKLTVPVADPETGAAGVCLASTALSLILALGTTFLSNR